MGEGSAKDFCHSTFWAADLRCKQWTSVQIFLASCCDLSGCCPTAPGQAAVNAVLLSNGPGRTGELQSFEVFYILSWGWGGGGSHVGGGGAGAGKSREGDSFRYLPPSVQAYFA